MPTLRFSTETETMDFGGLLAAQAQAGDVIALSGPLGAGKTVLAKGFIKQKVGEGTDVSSPTFTLVHVYDQVQPPIWHFDLFRLEAEEEMAELGLDEALTNGISLIEWPEKAGSWLPPDRLHIELAMDAGSERRRATVTGGPSWTSRLDDVLAHV